MKKLLSVLLAVFMLMQVVCITSSANEQYLDPFNNDLFTVVKEITVQDGYMPNGVVIFGRILSDDYTLAKLTKEYYNENGDYIVEELTDFLSSDEFYDKYMEFARTPEYNDGLKEIPGDDGMGFGYYDIDGNEICYGIRGQGGEFSYNLGLLRDAYGGMNMDTGMYDNVTTTFKKVMTDGSEYKFDADFTDFSDDGYAIMEKDDKFYLVKLKKGVILTVFYNGEKIAFDQVPIIEEGRTLVPLRAIFEKIGAEVSWDGDTQTVTATKDDITVSLTINNTTATKNGETVTLDVPAKIVGGRTLVPVRFISDCFGVEVAWDGVMQRVSLTK